MRQPLSTIIAGLLLFTTYFFTALMGLEVSSVNQFAALIWAPSGIALAALVGFGLRIWPAIFGAAVLVNWVSGAPIGAAFGIGIGNSLEALAGAYLLTRDGHFLRSFERFEDVKRLVVWAAFTCTALSATVGVGSLWISGVISDSAFAMTWLQWWAGDAIAILTVTPLLLAVSDQIETHSLRKISKTRVAHAVDSRRGDFLAKAFFALLLLITTTLVMSEPSFPGSSIFQVYLLFPFLIWAALAFGQRASIWSVFLISLLAVWFSTQGVGPFSHSGFEIGRLQIMFFVLTVALTGLVMAAIAGEREQARRAADAANAAKTQFLANMSHEIRTPLGVVLGFSELIAQDEIEASERFEIQEMIKRNGRLLSNIINDILDLSKIEAGKLDVEKTQVSLDDVLRDLTTTLAFEARAKGLEFKLASEGPLPISLQTDLLRLRQILFNLVGNAIKFTDRGSVQVTLRLLEIDKRSKLAFVVRDSGRGIPFEQTQRLFQPFMQADASTTRVFGGTGLGLALSQKLARALGGDVALLSSAAGIGSVFMAWIDPGQLSELSYELPSTRLDFDSSQNKTSRASETKLAGHRILLVEDNADNQLLISHFLQNAGAEVEAASNGIDGLERALTGEFDLILMDLQMPGMDGFEVVKELRKRGRRMPIVALTGHAKKEDRTRCLESGFDGHLSKPFDSGTLVNLVSRTLAADSGWAH